METSSYQLLKIYILSYLPITKDAVHVYVGIIGLLLMVLIVRSPINSLKTLAPIFALSFVMEAFDLYDDLRSFGYFRWGASLHDVINTTLTPVVLVILFKLRWIPLVRYFK